MIRNSIQKEGFTLEKFDEAYTDFGAFTQNVDPRTLERDGSTNQNEEVPGIDLPGGMKALQSLANVPKSWPLARLTIPLSAASKHLERLLEGCCNEIYVRNTNPDLQLHFVRKFAKDLVVVLAFHLAETIAALSKLRLKKIHHHGDDLIALSHDLGNLAILRPNGPENKVNSHF